MAFFVIFLFLQKLLFIPRHLFRLPFIQLRLGQLEVVKQKAANHSVLRKYYGGLIILKANTSGD